jgi:hypothetical protein
MGAGGPCAITAGIVVILVVSKTAAVTTTIPNTILLLVEFNLTFITLSNLVMNIRDKSKHSGLFQINIQ